MKPDDLIEGGLIRDSDLEGGPATSAELGPFGRYVLIEEIGRGGAAIVYRALDPLLNRELALKRLRFGDPELEARFLREAELLARLSHSGIVPIFDFGREGDSHYYTMPLAAGFSLDGWILEHRPGALEAARIVRQASEALAHAHERGVLHRDVKPANILINAEGATLLADFGLGRIEGPEAGEAGRVTQSGEVMGTPSYMAPELATRDLKGADARCDVYSMGATLYETLTGRPPFIGRSSLEILKRATSEEPVSPRKLASGTPVDLEIICLKALEKDPARRYGTVRELADDLGRFLAGEPIRARRAGVMYRARRFIGRKRALAVVAAAGILVAAAVGGTAWFRERSAILRRETVDNYLHEARRQHDIMDRSLVTVSQLDPGVQESARRAIDLLDQAIQEDPSDGVAWYLKGITYAMRFQAAEALSHYDNAVKLGYARARLERAILNCQKLIIDKPEMGSEAFVSLRRTISEDLEATLKLPALPERGLASALLDVAGERWPEAAEKLEGYTAETDDWRAYYWLGVSHMESALDPSAAASERSARSDKARQALESALTRRTRCGISVDILDRLGVLLLRLKRVEESISRFREAIALDETRPRTRYHLANALLHGKRDYDAAIAEVDIGMKNEPAPEFIPATAHAIRGQAYACRTDRASLLAACESLETALRGFPPGSRQAPVLERALKGVRDRLAGNQEGRD